MQSGVMHELAQRRSLLVGLALTAATSVLLSIYLYESSDDLRVVKPDWMRERGADDLGGAPVVLNRSSSKLAAVAKNDRIQAPAVESPIEDMLPTKQLSQDMLAVEQKVAFQVEAVMGGDVSAEVAAEMVDAATRHWEVYQSLKGLQQSGKLPPEKACDLAMMDFFFATWPDLGVMIRASKVQLAVYPVDRRAPGASLANGSIFYTLNIPDRLLSVSFHMPAWRVSAKFDSKSSDSESGASTYAHIFDVAAIAQHHK